MAKKRSIKRPKVVKVKESYYKLVPRSNAWQKKHNAMGRIDYKNLIIEFDRTQPDIDLVDTFIHEFLHSIIAEYKIKIKGSREEALVTKMSQGLTTLFLENEDLLEWLHNKLKRRRKKT